MSSKKAIRIVKRGEIAADQKMSDAAAEKSDIRVDSFRGSTAEIVAGWIDEFRQTRSVNTRRAFANLFRETKVLIREK